MSDSDSSELSSVPSEDENDLTLEKRNGILRFFSKAPSTKDDDEPPRPKREPSPPHEFVMADNQDIAFIVMFRARFSEAFPKNLSNFGPQEIERGVVDTAPSEHVESLLCAILGLLLNRKQDVKVGHYHRALEEAILSHRGQWPLSWQDRNPLLGGTTFASMDPTQRLTLLRHLILWSLSSSDVIKGVIQSAYKQNRHEDDLNQPLSVQPWGSDSDKRRYFLIEGLDDTCFRVYRESNPAGMKRTWMSVAGDIPELQGLADKLQQRDGGQKARLLASKIRQAIPRFEATEEKRKRREYRQNRKQQFKRPDPGMSLYEGRTRGKRIKYTYSDEEEEYSESGMRRSARNTGTHTPAEPGHMVTASGRHVRQRVGGMYGESLLAGTADDDGAYMDGEVEDENGEGRLRRNSRHANGYGRPSRHADGYNPFDEMDDDDDASEPDYGDDEEDGDVELESEADDGEFSDEGDEDDFDLGDGRRKSLVVKLPVKSLTPEKKAASAAGLPTDETAMQPEPPQESMVTLVPDMVPSEPVPEPPSVSHAALPTQVDKPERDYLTSSTTDALIGSPLPTVSQGEHGSGITPSSGTAADTPSAANLALAGPSSPSLTFRGTAEAPQVFRASIDVGPGKS